MAKISIPKLSSIKWKNGALADNVLPFTTYGINTIPVSDVLRGCYEENMKSIAVFGYKQDGEEVIFSNCGRYEETAYMFARGHLAMIRIED